MIRILDQRTKTRLDNQDYVSLHVCIHFQEDWLVYLFHSKQKWDLKIGRISKNEKNSLPYPLVVAAESKVFQSVAGSDVLTRKPVPSGTAEQTAQTSTSPKKRKRKIEDSSPSADNAT